MSAPRQAGFREGERVRVKSHFRAGHVRTPFYIKGKTGWVQDCWGEFLNPESLGHGGDGLPRVRLYRVGFHQRDVWDRYDAAAHDKIFVDIFEHWLEPASGGPGPLGSEGG